MAIRNPIRQQYNPEFDENNDEWILQVPANKVSIQNNGNYEIRLPIYLTRTFLSIGGSILRPKRRAYRSWLLKQQGGKCAICGIGDDPEKGEWTLDHQPQLNEEGSLFIDYNRTTNNRVIHKACDKSQNRRESK